MGTDKKYQTTLVTDIKVDVVKYIQDWLHINSMARGQQKIQSQQKNAERQAKLKKAGGTSQKKSANAALVFTCSVCMSKMPDPKTYKQHFESKHPKNPLPAELRDA